MGGPIVTDTPDSILMAIEDANLSIHSSSGTAITVSIKGDCLDEISVTVRQVQVKAGLVICG